jgi:hypothetical protein
MVGRVGLHYPIDLCNYLSNVASSKFQIPFIVASPCSSFIKLSVFAGAVSMYSTNSLIIIALAVRVASFFNQVKFEFHFKILNISEFFKLDVVSAGV